MAYWLVKTEPGTYSWADLVRECLRHSLQSELGTAVGGEPSEGHLPSHAAELDDRPGPAGARVRQHRAGQRGRAEHMHLEQVAQLRVGRFLGGADVSAPGVIDQHVDPAVPADDVLDRGADRGAVGHVERKRINLAGVRRREIVQ